ncbi:MAG TPA: hypothetical protein VJ461_06870 [Candidatus Nanoarchaeia archaeon]|nr:hypothetical protein [Candidatus Nanoarchaeia archaeon]
MPRISKKALNDMGFIVIGILLALIVFFLLTGGFQKILVAFKNTTTTISSCGGVGQIGGTCVAQASDYCKTAIKGLGCKGDKPICCFTGENENPGSVGPVGITEIKIRTPGSLPPTTADPFWVACNTNIEAPGCVVVEIEDYKITCTSETWTDNSVQFTCPAITQSGTHKVKCRVDTTKCNVVEGQEEKTAQLIVS